MAELTPKERVLRALRREEPDRVPHFEWLVDRQVREAILPGCRDHNEFAVRTGHDAVVVDPVFEKTPLADGFYRSEWGYVGKKTQEEHGIEVRSPIKTMADLERYTPPDPCAPGRYGAVEEALATYGDRYAVIVHLNDVFSLPRCLMGMENLLLAIAAEPELVQALVDMSVDINLKMAREVAARGAQIVYTGDDVAATAGPLMSPRHFRTLFYPGLCRVIGGYKELGLYVIKHSDGNLWPISDMIVDSGIDCLDPIDPLAGMDLGEVKARYGRRIALKGNVDCAGLMTFGTPDETAAATREALRKGMPGGGYILSSSNSIHSGVRPENYLAMVRTLHECGRYAR
ncbi:MAG TPA: uroporphyrinogen decarboxylase family protein [Anaerolineae bacterium]|nr:uroporphyrinogen decarboxylase family protein [Anaerolineae bacterium]HPL27978.1 uroporphyrinogen decarboxylase family protein [Anaerolineae bacterium]